MGFDDVRAVEYQQTLLQIPVPRIAFGCRRVACAVDVACRRVSYGSRPGVVEFPAEPARQAFSDGGLQRMIGRVIVVAMKLNGAELWINHDEILRISVPAQQPAGD